MLGEKFNCPNFLFTQNGVDFLIHQTSSVVAVFATTRHEVFTEEDILLIVPSHWANLVAHAPFTDHATGQTGDYFKIV